jgi:hypothetical protein
LQLRLAAAAAARIGRRQVVIFEKGVVIPHLCGHQTVQAQFSIF